MRKPVSLDITLVKEQTLMRQRRKRTALITLWGRGVPAHTGLLIPPEWVRFPPASSWDNGVCWLVAQRESRLLMRARLGVRFPPSQSGEILIGVTDTHVRHSASCGMPDVGCLDANWAYVRDAKQQGGKQLAQQRTDVAFRAEKNPEIRLPWK